MIFSEERWCQLQSILVGAGTGVLLVFVANGTWRNASFRQREGHQRTNSTRPIADGQRPTRSTVEATNGKTGGMAQEDHVSVASAVANSFGKSASTELSPDRGAALDEYGGSTLMKCVKATGYFRVEKIDKRWWFCTPKGNVFWMTGVFAISNDTHITDLGTSYNDIAKSKYGDTDITWGPQQIRRIKSWGFNSIAEFSVGWTWPIWTCGAPRCPEWIKNGGKQPVLVPMTAQVRPSAYSLTNLFKYAPDAVKDTVYGINPGYLKGYMVSFPDIFDPNFGLWLDGEMRKDQIIIPAENSPWVIAWITDNCDELNGLCGAGLDLPTNPPGHNQRNIGLFTLVTSPVQTAHPQGGPAREVQEYSSPTVFSKAQLRDYLRKKYSDIAALNKAWGSRYTTFNTTGVQVTTEVIGMGDAKKTTFTGTLAHSDIAAYSLAVNVDGKKVGGDCPGWVNIPLCASAGPGAGELFGSPSGSPTVHVGTIRYARGDITITFAAAPSPGARISVDYIYNGWGYGTGLMDEDGRHGWIPTDSVHLGSNKTFKADMDGFLRILATEYFSTVTSTIRKYAPHNLVFGPGVLGTWNAPADQSVLEAAAPYVDGIATTLDDTRAQAELTFIASHLGDKPMIIWLGANANSDSALWRYKNATNTPCNPCNTQTDRANFYTNSLNSFLNTTNTLYDDYTVIGFRWWAFLDSWAEKADWGLVSLEDNPYDGRSATVNPGVDQWGYATGREEKNYGNFLDAVHAANLRWLSIR
jgi:hypothetical protein